MSPTKSIAIVCLLLIVGCGRDPEPVKTKVDLLTEKPWVYWSTMGRMTDNDTWRDLPFTKPDGSWTISVSRCVEDDVHTYRADGVLQRDQGKTYCDGSTEQIRLGTWELLNEDTRLRADFGSGINDFTIQVLSEEVLKIEFAISGIHVQTTYQH